jgi:HPt (histidine-containing phosphotransfer) domain-containing protein
MFQPDRKATGPMPPQSGSTTAPPRDAVRAAEPCAAATAAGAQPAIDLAHLDRMTFGEENLAREVLRLFDRQADTLLALAQIKRAGPSLAARLAHTLKGSARGIGAWKVAVTAEEYELAAQEADSEKLAGNFERLGRAILEARAAIRVLLAAP